MLAGTSMVSGEAQAVVFATGMHSEFGKIAHLTQTGREAVSPLREQIAYLSRLIGILAVAIGLIFFAISHILGVPFWEDFIFAIGIIVAMVPEGAVAYFDACAGPGHAANGKTPCFDPLPAIGRDARLDHRDLYRQDRHVDTKPNDGKARLAGSGP